MTKVSDLSDSKVKHFITQINMNISISHYLCFRLYELGVREIFGIVGDFSLSLFQFLENSKINVIPCCNELNAAYAADGYARMNGIGALAVTYGAGELSAINGIAGAFAENIPVVMIGGVPSNSDYESNRPLHHTLGNYNVPLKIIEHITIDSVIIHKSKSAAVDIDRCLMNAIYHRKPCYIGIPSDMVGVLIEKPTTKLSIPSRPKSSKRDLKSCIKKTLSALEVKNPLVVIDDQVIKFGLQSEVRNFLDKSGLPHVTHIMGKGAVDETNKMFRGVYSGSRSKCGVKFAVSSADLILVIGLKNTDFNSGGFTIDYPTSKTIFVGMNSVNIFGHVHKHVNILEFLTHLTSKVEDFAVAQTAYRMFEKKSEIKPNQEIHEDHITIEFLFDRVSEWMPEDCVVIAETGSAVFAASEMKLSKNSVFLSQLFYGSIGYTVGATLGASFQNKKRVISFIGDGSFQMTAQEVSTMIRYKKSALIFILNNNGYLVEKLIGIGEEFNDIQNWKYSQLPVVFGGEKGFIVKNNKDLKKVLRYADKNPDKLIFVEVNLQEYDAPQNMISAADAMAKTNHVMERFYKRRYWKDFTKEDT